MGNGLWLAHQDRVGFGWLTKPAENPWSGTTQKATSVLEWLIYIASEAKRTHGIGTRIRLCAM